MSAHFETVVGKSDTTTTTTTTHIKPPGGESRSLGAFDRTESGSQSLGTSSKAMVSDDIPGGTQAISSSLGYPQLLKMESRVHEVSE